MFTLVVCATGGAWATYENGTALSWKSRDSITTKTNLDGGGYSFKIKLPVSDDLPKFSRVKITQIKLGARSGSAVSACGAYIRINGVNSDSISAFDGTMPVDSSGSASLNVCNYAFTSDLILMVGIEYTMQPYNSSGTAINAATAAIKPLPSPQVIYFGSDTSWCCAYEVYGEVISTVVPTYKASPSGTNVSLNSLSWTLDDEAADLPSDLSTCGLEVTLNDGATLAIDKDISAIITFALKGENATLDLVDSSYVSAATAWDFSGFTGNLTFNVDDDIDATISACLKPWMNSDLKGLTVKVSGDDSVAASWSGNTTFTTHTTFDGGTANLEVIQDSDGIDLCNNSSNVNPLWRVKDNTILNLTGKDLGGWSAAQKAQNCVMAVDGGGRLNLKDNGKNTFFYQGRFLLAPGATLDVQTTNNRLKLNGGRTSGYEQIYVPDQITDMTATPAVVSGTGAVNANNNGFGIYVGENAQLDWSASIVRNGSAKIAKYGAGTLKIIGKDIGFPIDGNGGTIELSATKSQNKISVAQEFSGKLKLVAPTTTDYWWGFTDLTGAQHLPDRPELELAMSTQFLYLADVYNNGANPLTVKNLSGSATITSSWGGSSAGDKIIDSLQTANTTFSGVFTGDTNDASALTVHGADNASTIYKLTLSGVNDTRGPLTIENNAKVVFPSTGGSWASGTVTVGNGGYLEAQNTTALGAVTLQDGATIVIPTASSTVVPLTGTTVTLPTSGMVNVDLTGVSAADSETVTIISATTLVNADASIFRQTEGCWRFSVDNNTIKATKLGTATWSDGTWSDSDLTGYASASITVSGTQDVTLPATTSFDTLTITGSGTVTLTSTSSETCTVAALSIGAGVTLNASNNLVVTGAISGDGALVLDVPSEETMTLPVTTASQLTKRGNGELILDGNTTVSGDVSVEAGTLTDTAGKVLNIGDSLTVKTGTELNINGEVRLNKNPGSTVTAVMILESGATCVVGGNLFAYKSEYVSFTINGSVTVNGNFYSLGDISVGSTGAITVGSSGGVAALWHISNSGTITLPALANLKKYDNNHDQTKITNSSTGKVVFNLTANMDVRATDLTTYFAGSGKIVLNGNVWCGFSRTGQWASTIAVENNLKTTSGGFVFPRTSTIGTLSGDGLIRADLDTGASDPADRVITVVQAANSEWSGTLYKVKDKMGTFAVSSAKGATKKTLTLSGTQQSGDNYTGTGKPLVVNAASETTDAGSVNLTGTWVGDATVDGEFGGTGSITGALTLNAGSTFKVWATGGLTVTGALTLPASGTVAVDVSDLTIGAGDSTTLLTVDSGMPANVNKFALDSATHMLSISGQTLSLVPIAATLTSNGVTTPYATVDQAVGLLTTGLPGDSYVTLVHGTTSDLSYTDEQLTAYNIVYNSANGRYVLAEAKIGTVLYPTIEAAIAEAAENDVVELARDVARAEVAVNYDIEFSEGSYTFTGSFTGNGTLALPDGTRLKSPSPDRWATGWTGTVWIRNYTSLTGKSTQGGNTYGSTSFEPNDYGNINSTVKFTGVKGYFTAHNNESYTIQPALELEDDGDTPGLLLYNGWGYNSNAQCYTIIRELKGSGTLKADPTIVNNSIPGLNVLLQVCKWDNFTGTLNMPNKNVAFGSTRPEQSDVEGGGHISIQSGASVEVPAGKTWTVGNGVVVYGNLSLGTGAAIANTNAANTWIKSGTGTITLNALNDLPATPASTWQGTIVLPAVGNVGDNGFDFSTYGVDGSTIKIANGFTGWLKRANASVQPAANFNITSAFTITGTSAETYVLKKLSGTGDFTISDIRNANSFTISLVDGFSGSIVNTLGTDEKKIVITRLNIDSDPTMAKETKILNSTTADKITVQNVYYNDVSVNLSGALSIVNKADGVYIVRAGTIFSVW